MTSQKEELLEDSSIVTSRPYRVGARSGFQFSGAALAALRQQPLELRDADFRAGPRRFLGIGTVAAAGAWRDPAIEIVDRRIPRVNERRRHPGTVSEGSFLDVSAW